jgi:capsular exopolysaccharide synthesis family protein
MSRIHEALKKAQQEMSANHVGSLLDVSAETASFNGTVQSTDAPKPVLPHDVAAKSILKTSSVSPEFDELRAKCARPAWNTDKNLMVFSNSDPFASGAEQFRTLRSRLYRIRENRALRIILIVSAAPQEGKTFIAANLAECFVRQRGCRVLLVDGDLRSPQLHARLGAPSKPGLAEYLQGEAKEFEIIQKSPNNEELYFIPAGNHITHPSELISNSRLSQLLNHLAPMFDWVIVDSPPILPVSDASVLAEMCDGALLVVRAGSTPSEAAQRACHELPDEKIVGVALNTVEGNAASYGYGKYGQHSSKPSQK